jgi:hypothetical protein
VRRPVSCHHITEDHVYVWMLQNRVPPPQDFPEAYYGLIAADIMGVRRVLPTYEDIVGRHVRRLNRRAGAGVPRGRPSKSRYYGEL